MYVARAIGTVPGASNISVELLDRDGVPSRWRDGLVLRVSPPATGEAPDSAKVSVDYGAFRGAYGGSWGSRLKLWQLPACALSTPNQTGCAATPLPSTNDGSSVTAEVPVRASVPRGGAPSKARQQADAPTAEPVGTLLALAAGTSGSEGDFAATPLAASSTWSSGTSTGNFSWSYPMRVPPPAAGPTPKLSLAYSSASVDGKSQANNNQPSWVGEGFDYWPGYIERSYMPCAEDMANGANNASKTGDQCWRSDNATMSLNGGGSELVYQAGKGWHPRQEDGSKIEKLTGATNGDNNGEYWKITTQDGTQYFFGLNNLPAQSSTTKSTWTLPVAGNHSGEPCNNSGGFKASFCTQAWRWNLDYVVDTRGNTMSYWYDPEANYYGRNLISTDKVSYTRGGTLARIDYGTWDRGSTDRSVNPTGQVVINRGDRCEAGCATHDATHWKDVPWDQECLATAADCKQNYAPTFWSTKRLTSVITQIWDTTKPTPAWQTVDSWTLSHAYPSVGDGSDYAGMWLNSLTHTGLVNGSIALPPVTFEPTALRNRVLTAHNTTNNRMRIAKMVTETGAKVQVTYSLPDCSSGNLPSAPEINTRLCYPVIGPDPYTPDGPDITEYWHKYVVRQVSESDIQIMVNGTDHGQPTVNTFYTYLGTPAWHYADDDGLIKPDRKTWSQFRGYATVETRVGDAPTQTLTRTTYLRGMHGDRLNPSGGTRDVTVNASIGSETVKDEDQYAGMVREATTYNGIDTKPVSRTVNVPWMSPASASRTINGDTVTAHFTNTGVTYTATALGVDGAEGWRVRRSESNLDDTYGTVNWNQDDGDTTKTGDEKCTTYTYNRNLAGNIVTTVKQTTTKAVTCAAAPTSTDDIVSDELQYYDGATSAETAPTYGTVTRTDRLKDWSTANGTVWQTIGQTTVDAFGRPKTVTDARLNTATTDYVPATGPVARVTTKTPDPNGGADWINTVDQNPYWGVPAKTTDQNGRVIEADHDALGRTTKVWKIGWTRAGHDSTPSVEYSYNYAASRDAYPFLTTRTLNAAGGYLTSYQISDALLRVRQIQIAAVGGGRVVTDTLYDKAGRAESTYASHAEPGMPAGALWWEPEWSVPALTRSVYDNASRPTDVIFFGTDGVSNLVEKWRTVTNYRGDRVQVTPPAGGTPTTTLTDIEGRTTDLQQHTTAQGVNGPYVNTHYTYNRKGQLVTLTDPDSNEWTYVFDVKGRQTSAQDPDKGLTTSTYNDYDDLATTTDANNKVLAYEYDKIGRKIGLYDNQVSVATKRTSWTYDKLPDFTAVRGQLTQATRFDPPGSTNAYAYRITGFTARYQPTGTQYLIPNAEAAGIAGTWSYGYGYATTDGSPTDVTYPSAGGLTTEKVTTNYDVTTGLPATLTTNLLNAGTYVAGQLYTAYGEPTLTMRKTDGGVYVENSVSYDLTTRRVIQTQVQPETSPGTVADHTYSYDSAGNITKIADTPGVGTADAQCFRYDTLSRLVTAWTPMPDIECSMDPTVASLGAPARYWHDWTFDNVGNRRTETKHANAGDTIRNFAYPVGGKDVIRPHALTSVTTQAPGQSPATNNYAYDNAGNTTCRPGGTVTNNCPSDTSSQTLSWSPEGLLTTVSGASASAGSNIYDAAGARLVRRDATGSTLYLPDQEIRAVAGITSTTRYYHFAGQIIGSRNGTGLTWTYTDHQGTQDTTVDALRQTVSVRRQDPYGVPRGSGAVWVNSKGFVGGDNDPNGLTHLGAREYDPVVGRFISVDPIQDLSNPQQWHGYAYANNSPVTASDPTGLNPADAQWDGPPLSKQSQANYDSEYGTPKANASGRPPTLADIVNRPVVKGGGVPDYVRATGRYHGSDRFTYKDAQEWAQQDPVYADYLCYHILNRDESQCAGFYEKIRPTGPGGWKALLGVLFVGAAYATVLVCIPAIIECVAAVGEFVATGSPLGAAGIGAVTGVTRITMEAGIIGVAEEADGAALLSRACSFSGDTPVLMADRTTRAIRDLKVGDSVEASDPVSGERGARRIDNIWTHEDSLKDLSVDGHRITTTEDHPYWNATDGQWERADELGPRDLLMTPSGATVPVEGLISGSVRYDTAYNLTVNGIHTYYVIAGDTPVLVHNDNPGGMVGANGTQITSSTVWLRGPYRIDVENPNPGVRPGQMHFQDQATGAKYLYNYDTGKFDGMPNSLQKELDKKMPDYKKAIAKGNRFLGMSGC
ncbi:RHS repeat-associated core domain-containing protein [Micromonospora sp. NPDC049257]|uniref:RHS repeat-associated core domain-containing protein n=1 Tax=Micromonospora sp. NPDC049257 TaxID=3155771 RepID=UPI00343F5815